MHHWNGVMSCQWYILPKPRASKLTVDTPRDVHLRMVNYTLRNYEPDVYNSLPPFEEAMQRVLDWPKLELAFAQVKVVFHARKRLGLVDRSRKYPPEMQQIMAVPSRSKGLQGCEMPCFDCERARRYPRASAAYDSA